MFLTHNPALLIIDVQKAIDCYSSYERNNLDAEEKIARVLAQWRRSDRPVIHVQHSSKSTDSPYHEKSAYYGFKTEVTPVGSERIITKHENSAFIGTHLDSVLKKQGVSELVICGVLTNNSVDATVRVGSGLGYRIYVPQDMTAAFGFTLLNGTQASAEDVHWMFLSNLDGEYCNVCSSEQVLKGVSLI